MTVFSTRKKSETQELERFQISQKMSASSTTDELEKHVQKKYEILAKLGKGVSID